MHSTMSTKAMISLYFWNKVELSFCNFHCRLQIEIKSFWSSESSVHVSGKRDEVALPCYSALP